jgi:O-antigen/teichoic acid export membrane protein
MWNKRTGIWKQSIASLRAQSRTALATKLARSTLFYSLNFSVQIFLQLGYFLLLVRTFDAKGYGLLVSSTAVILFLSNFVGWGCERILIQRRNIRKTLYQSANS